MLLYLHDEFVREVIEQKMNDTNNNFYKYITNNNFLFSHIKLFLLYLPEW